MNADSIVALSSGQGRAAIAVVRISGAAVRFVSEMILSKALFPRVAARVDVHRTNSDGTRGAVIDRALGLFFPAPRSATGEDVLELHVHGGIAVVQEVLSTILKCGGEIRLAAPGEFTRRALENGKLDLLEVEALGELLSAETSLQLQQANRQLSGQLGRMIQIWASELVDIRAMVEAELDFSDEGDVGDDSMLIAASLTEDLLLQMLEVLSGAERGERLRDGVRVVIVGRPNVGKSSLMNALAKREIAIVSAAPGTTRDVIESHLHIDGWPVILSDTAGLRSTIDEIESEGVRRARNAALEADIVLSLLAADIPEVDRDEVQGKRTIRVQTKSDLGHHQADGAIQTSSVSGAGLDDIMEAIARTLRDTFQGEPALLSRQRQREALTSACEALKRAGATRNHELMAEELRLASRALGRLSGHVDLDSVLDRLFEGFCIGK